jgi:hypothetical protein
MSASGSSHRKHRRKGALARLFDRLQGKKQQRSTHQHVSGFPGISLPRDYDLKTGNGPNDGPASKDSIPASPPPPSNDFSKPVPEKILEFTSEASRFKPAPKNKFRESIKIYLKKRALKKEERKKERLKRKLKEKHQKEYRKQEQGRGLRKKLFNEWGKEIREGETKLALFDRNSAFYRAMTIVVNSSAIFIFTYVIAYLFYWLLCMLVASVYGIDSTLYYYDLKFNDHSALWTRFNVLMVTGIPPFMSLFAGLFFLRFLAKQTRFVGLQKLFMVWLAFHLINHFFGAFPSGVVTNEGFGYVAAWMYMNTAMKFLFSLLSLFGMGMIGYYASETILETSDSVNRIKSDNRVSFILNQLALPWLIGTAILLLLRLPKGFEYPYETLMFFSMAFLVIPPFFNEKVKPKLNLIKIKKRKNFHIGYLAMMLVMLAFLRILLGIGLHFLIEINVSISLGGGI